MNSITKSLELRQRALQFMPGPHSNLTALWWEMLSRFMVRGKGAHLWDVDGNEYIDYAIAVGAGILGHANEEYNQALKEQLDKLTSLAMWFQIPHEIELVEKFAQYVPCAERVRFTLSGTEAVQLAIRLARAYTKRRYFIRFEGHYHGWMDNVLGGVVNDRARGKPFAVETPADYLKTEGRDTDAFKQSFKLPWNDIEVLESVLEKYGEEVAIIHMEPILCNYGCCLPRPGYLERVRELCTKYGIVFSLDEIITGFRVSLNGAQGLLGVTSDIATFGKAMGGGIPISAVVGKKEILDLLLQRRVIAGGTFNGNPLGTAAALATIKILERDNGAFYKKLDKVQGRLTQGLKEIAKRRGIPMLLQGPLGVFNYEFIDKEVAYSARDFKEADAERQKKFRALMLEEGIIIYVRGRWYVCGAVTEADVDKTLEAADRAMRKL